MIQLISQYPEAMRAYKSGGQYCYAVYYDDPGQVVNQKEMRMDLGFFFHPKDEEQKEIIIKAFSKFSYQYVKFKESECLHGLWTVKRP